MVSLLIVGLFGSYLNVYLYAILILILKLFICLSFGTIYVAHLELFDSSFLNTSYGIVNIITGIAELSCPMIAEVDDVRIPLLLLLILNLIAFFVSMFIKRAH